MNNSRRAGRRRAIATTSANAAQTIATRTSAPRARRGRRSRAAGSAEQAAPHRLGHHRRAVGHAQLPLHPLEVGLHRPRDRRGDLAPPRTPTGRPPAAALVSRRAARGRRRRRAAASAHRGARRRGAGRGSPQPPPPRRRTRPPAADRRTPGSQRLGRCGRRDDRRRRGRWSSAWRRARGGAGTRGSEGTRSVDDTTCRPVGDIRSRWTEG
jgi:hypothetical protein